MNKNKIFKFGPFCLDPQKRYLTKDGETVPLTDQSFDILLYLLEKEGQWIDKEAILKHFWKEFDSPGSKVDDSYLSHPLGKIWKALSDKSGRNEYIETIRKDKKRKAQIRFIGKVEIVYEEDPLPSPEPIIDTPPDTGKSFQEWLFDLSQEKAIKTIIFSCVLLTIILSVILCFSSKREIAASVASAVQMITILILIFYLPKADKSQNQGNHAIDEKVIETLGYEKPEDLKQAIKVAKRFQSHYELYWRFAWSAWAFVYLLILMTDIYKQIKGEPLVFIVKDGFNNISTVSIILCYIILYKPIVAEKTKLNDSDALWSNRIEIAGLVCVAVPLVLEYIILVSLTYSNISNKEIALLYVEHGFSLISGILAGIAIALYVGRLQSRYFNPPLWLIILLFSYTAVQPFYWDIAAPQLAAPQLFTDKELTNVQSIELIEGKIDGETVKKTENPQLQKLDEQLDKQLKDQRNQQPAREMISQIAPVVLINLTLILKCLLYLYTTWILQSGRLLFYLERIGKTDQEKVEKEWSAFQTILGKKG
jgi:DNA-binding winged helix-turn-helix (wHTH) protein